MKLFSIDSPIMQFLSKLFDIIMLNILFLICSLPIITVGASMTALYSVTLKMVKNEESYIFRSFFSAFKSCFRHSTVSWLIMLAAGSVVWMDYRILGSTDGTFSRIFTAVLIPVCMMLLFTSIYIFPFIARFENTLKNSIKNAFLISIAQLHYTFLLLLLLALAAAFTLFVDLRITGFVWFVLGFSGLAYLNSFLLRRAFRRFE